MSTLNGSDVLIFINDGLTDVAIACQRGVDVNIIDNVIDITCKQDGGWMEVIGGKREFEFTCDALVAFNEDMGIEQLFDAFKNKTELQVTVANPLVTIMYYTGEMYCTSISVNAPTEDVVSYTATFKGTLSVDEFLS